MAKIPSFNRFYYGPGKVRQMVRRLDLWKGSKFQAAVIVIAALIAFLGATSFAIQSALKNMLERHSYSTGMDWASHIEARAPSLTEVLEQQTRPLSADQYLENEFVKMADGILSVGNIYQIDVVDADLSCVFSRGSSTAFTANRSTNGAAHHNHGNMVADSQAGHTPGSEQVGSKAQLNPYLCNQDGRFPLDRALLTKIAEDFGHPILVNHVPTADQPSRFAEVFHPVAQQGNLRYILRIMVDLEEENRALSKTLYFGTGLVLSLLVIAFAYPASKYVRSEKQKKQEAERTRFLASYDVMTNTKNRNAFQRLAPKTLQRCRAKGETAMLFIFDLDHFKEVNDSLGHPAGDALICAFADLLKGIAPDGSLVARIGGDEFAVLVENVGDEWTEHEQIISLPEKIETTLKEVSHDIETTISAGVGRFPRDGGSLEELLRNTDLALYTAKSTTGGSVREYDPRMGEDFSKRMDLRKLFEVALENDEIVPFYQPLVDMHSGSVVGLEALARWDHPSKGILPPAIFEEMLENLRFGALVTKTMFSRIISDIELWRISNVPFGRIGLNIGQADFLDPDFPGYVIDGLKNANLTGEVLTIEVTENCIFGKQKQQFVNQLEELSAFGCKISLDDFGTGFSSIAQIKDLPCSTLKIDRSFVSNVTSNKADRSIVIALQGIGEALECDLVVEGTETKDQIDLLKSLRCDVAQGFFFSRPVSATQLPDLITELNNRRGRSEDQKKFA